MLVYIFSVNTFINSQPHANRRTPYPITFSPPHTYIVTVWASLPEFRDGGEFPHPPAPPYNRQNLETSTGVENPPFVHTRGKLVSNVSKYARLLFSLI